MTEFTIGENAYRVDRLNAFAQFHIVRRLAPAMTGLAGSLQNGFDPIKVFEAVSSAVAAMSDADAEFVIKTALGVVMRKDARSDRWVKMVAPGGGLMFEDLSLPDLMQLVWKVLESNLGDFFGALPAALKERVASPPAR